MASDSVNDAVNPSNAIGHLDKTAAYARGRARTVSVIATVLEHPVAVFTTRAYFMLVEEVMILGKALAPLCASANVLW